MIFNNIDWSNPWLTAVILNTTLIMVAFILPKKLLTVMGYLNAWVLGVIIWGCLGWQGYTVVMFYFLVGSTVTRIGKQEKEALGIAEKRDGMRGPENVWGSALVGAVCALGVLFVSTAWQSLLILGYVASFATKLSDTSASEVGKAYGKKTFLITTFQPVKKGTEGAVSLEGTGAGIVASILISLVALSIGMISPTGVVIAIIASFIATNIESFIGATLQTNLDWLTNELVNVINTLVGALVAILLGYFLMV